MIRIEDLVVTFNAGTPMAARALDGLSMTMSEGEFVTVIGSNGAGKTTLLNAISGDARPAAGRIILGDEDVTGWPRARRAGMVARVFQDPMAGSCANLTIAENLALAATRGRRHGLTRAVRHELRTQMRAKLTRLGLGLEHRLDEAMAMLSGGQRQVVGLVMATFRPAQILLLDEHTAALDPKTAAFVIDLTRDVVAEQGMTTLMVTHSMRQALSLGTRTIMLHEGRIALDVSGPRRADLDVEALVQMFERVRGTALDDDALLLD